MSLFCSVTFFAMELFEQLGFAEAKLIVAVISASLRAIGNIFAGPIVIFKGMYSTKSLNGNPSNGNNPLNGNFFNLPNGLLHKTRGFWKLFLQNNLLNGNNFL